MSPSSLLVHVKGNTATLTLNRPEKHNALNEELIDALTVALKECDDDPNVRVVLLKATGKSFCAGADVSWMQRMVNYSQEENLKDAKQLARLFHTLYYLSKPTIAAVQGAAYGGGIGLVCCCDIAIASDEARFCLSEVKLGLVAATIAPFVIQAIGPRITNYLLVTTELINSLQARQYGLVHQTVPHDNLETAEQHTIENILNNAPQALRISKELVRRSAPIDDALFDYTAQLIATVRASPEGQEGLKAFLEKRKPGWLS